MLLKIFSKRLADSMELNGKKQIDVARELGIPKSTLSLKQRESISFRNILGLLPNG